MSTATVPEGREGYFPHWKLKTTGVIMPEERLPWGQTIVSGMQHGVDGGRDDYRTSHHGF
jgi:putative pyrimidine permease RutG